MPTLPITAPYDPMAQDVLGKTHRQRVYARITTGGTATTVEISDGTVALSEDWSPHQRFSISSPAVAELLALADPRQPTRIEVLAGYIYPGGSGEDVQVLATGHIRNGENDTPGDAHAMECTSDELRTQDNRWMGTRQTKSFAGVVEAIAWMLDYACPTAQTINTQLPDKYRPDLVSAVALEPGQPLWDQLYAIALAAGLWIYVDSTGAWRLEPRPTAAGEAAALLREGPESLVKKITHRQDIDPYYTAAVLQYKWKDSGGVDREIFGKWAPPADSRGTGAGHKVFFAERAVQTDQYSADEAARLTVAQLSTRGDSYTIEAVAAYWIRPGHTVAIGAGDIRHIVKTVTFDLGAGSMTLATREPSNLGEN
jgi:hypothetical protein